MKKLFNVLSLAAVLAVSASQATAQAPLTATPAFTQARAILAKGNVCEWYRHEDRIHWDFATQKTSDDWMAALTSISTELKVDEKTAERRLLDLCRQQLAGK